MRKPSGVSPAPPPGKPGLTADAEPVNAGDEMEFRDVDGRVYEAEIYLDEYVECRVCSVYI